MKSPTDVLVERLSALPHGQQGRIAELAGLAPETLSRYRRQNRKIKINPRLSQLEALAETLGRPISWLLCEDDGSEAESNVQEIPEDVRAMSEWILSFPEPARVKLAEFVDLFFANWQQRQNADGTMPSRLGKVLNIFLPRESSEGTVAPGGEDPGPKRKKRA